MSDELEHLNRAIGLVPRFGMDMTELALITSQAVALILKRQECSHEWVKSITSQQYVKAQAYVCNGCGLKETRF